MKRPLAMLAVFFCTNCFAYPLFTEGVGDLKARVDAQVVKALRSPLNFTFKSYVVLYSPRYATLSSYVSSITRIPFTIQEGCSDVLVICQFWKQTMRTAVSDNKHALRDNYLGCKLAYHAVSRTPVENDVPDDVLVACLADVYIPEGSQLLFERGLLVQ